MKKKFTSPLGTKYDVGKPHIVACSFTWKRANGISDFVAHPTLQVEDCTVIVKQQKLLTKT